ncbi:zf-HC2 domain-containing protein [uncultured Paludibaculum sp.]|uniref:anti-sigma factor family protein n=1 Tax=uncultured Paludibaculum sp. TaxID=1765020 RepID=UPI002AABDBC2|nr:zf-HC2 domain-containing protein [uncultured Paludibaculum sp.]
MKPTADLSTTCKLVQPSAELYADGQLGLVESLALRQHLDGCPACRKQIECELRIRQVVRRSVKSLTVPSSLVMSVYAIIRAAGVNRISN